MACLDPCLGLSVWVKMNDLFKNVIQKMWDEAVRRDCFSVWRIPDQYRAREISTCVVKKNHCCCIMFLITWRHGRCVIRQCSEIHILWSLSLITYRRKRCVQKWLKKRLAYRVVSPIVLRHGRCVTRQCIGNHVHYCMYQTVLRQKECEKSDWGRRVIERCSWLVC